MSTTADPSPDYRERWISAQDGLQLFLRDYGDPLAPGVPLLCLSGLARNSRDFVAFARRHAAGRRVVCPDYRGRGRSSYDEDWRNYRPEVYLRDIAALLAACNLHRLVVCGTSMGGLLAMGLAVSNPIVLAGAILNDVGPALATDALGRIRDHVARDRPLPDWAAAIDEAKRRHAELGYGDDEAKWRRFAEATFREAPDGRLRVDWDVRIARGLSGALPDLWPYFR
ncbi:MAG: alpha/beta fold hydrolase, partial [Kiloniellales bacterium]